MQKKGKGITKQLLKEYVDACVLVEESKERLEKIKNSRVGTTSDCVQASLKEFPYTRTTLKIEGAVPDDLEYKNSMLHLQEEEVKKQMAKAAVIKQQVEEYMYKIPLRMQRIIRYKYFDNMSWEQVADRIGRGATGSSLQMEFNRFLKKC